jgi:hypothetical protein
MIAKEPFIRIMNQCERLDKAIRGLEDALDIVLCNSELDNALNDIIEALADETEPGTEFYESDASAPAVFRYAFDYQWGQGFDKYIDCKTWTFNGEEFKVDSLDTLYDYLKLHWEQYLANHKDIEEILKNA